MDDPRNRSVPRWASAAHFLLLLLSIALIAMPEWRMGAVRAVFMALFLGACVENWVREYRQGLLTQTLKQLTLRKNLISSFADALFAVASLTSCVALFLAL